MSGGNGAYGGLGCECRTYQWEIDNTTYYCTNGERGWYGNRGSNGAPGNWGVLKLVQQRTVLPVEVKSRTILLSDLVTRSHMFREHVWQQKPNPSNLFARGSLLPPQYLEYTGTNQTEVSGQWSARRPLSEVSDVELNVQIEAGRLIIEENDSIWLASEITHVENQTTIDITNAVYKSEVKALTLRGIEGANRDLVAQLAESNAVNADIETTFSIRYYTRQRLRWYERYAGGIPAELIVRSNEGYTLAIGNLPIDPVYLQSGQRIFVKLYVKRKVGQNELTLTYDKEYQIQ